MDWTSEIKAVEWGGPNFPALMIAELFGRKGFRLKSRRPGDPHIPERREDGPIDILLGTPRTANECIEFAEVIRTENARASISATPSEAIPLNTCAYARSQHLWLDTAMHGDVLCAAWSIFVNSIVRLDCIIHPTGSWPPQTLADVYASYVLSPCVGQVKTYARRRIANSRGRIIITYNDSSGVETYGLASQLAIPRRCVTSEVTYMNGRG